MNMEEQIKETVKRWQYEDGYIHVDDMVKDLTSLLKQQEQEIREKAIKDFVVYLFRLGEGNKTEASEVFLETYLKQEEDK